MASSSRATPRARSAASCATNGDFTHGLIHPEQMIGGRLLAPGSAHATPIPGLWLCGAACEVAQALATADPGSALRAE